MRCSKFHEDSSITSGSSTFTSGFLFFLNLKNIADTKINAIITPPIIPTVLPTLCGGVALIIGIGDSSAAGQRLKMPTETETETETVLRRAFLLNDTMTEKATLWK